MFCSFLNSVHKPPPKSNQNQTDIEIANAVNSIDLMNGPIQPPSTTYNLNSASISSQTNESQSKLSNQRILNDCKLTQCNAINDSNAHLRSIHLVNTSSPGHSSTMPHQLVSNQQATTPNHYMIHVTNTNSQEQQITIEPMSNGVQLHSTAATTTNCTFTTNELAQLTTLNTAANDVCLENGSSINLTTLNNGHLTAENCLLTSDGDICWNTLLTDDSIGTYATTTTNTVPTTLTAIPITSQTTQVINPVINTQSSTNSTITNPTTTLSSNLLTDAQVNANQIHNSNLIQTSTTSYVDPTFTNQIDTMSNRLHNSQVISTAHVSCVNPQQASATNHPSQTSTWNANRNYMNLTYNQTSSSSDLNNTNLNNGTSATSLDNHDSSSIMQIATNGLTTDLAANCNHFDNSNSTWIECTLQCTLQNGKTFESNSFDLEHFTDLDNCSTY